MANCVEKLPHTCGTTDALQVWEENGRFTAYCFACDTYVPAPYESQPKGYKPTIVVKSPEMVAAQLKEVDGCKTVDLPDRKLKKESLNYFDIKIGLSEVDGSTPVTHYYPYYKGKTLSAYKARLIADKSMWSVGVFKGVDLFGWEQAGRTGSKRLFITEGELDAVALYQVLKQHSKGTKWEDYNPAVVSLTNGAGGAAKNIADNLSKIRPAFKEVVLVFDQDEPGTAATKAVMNILPEAMAVALPDKDPNACLMNGKSKALVNAVLFRAKRPKNTRVLQASGLFASAAVPTEWGIPWPFEALTDMTRGIRKGETIYIGAGVKMGKSEMCDTLAAHLMVDHNMKCFLIKPEEETKITLKKIAGKVAGRVFTDPKVEWDIDAYNEAVGKIGDNLYVLDVYQHLGWDTLRADISIAVQDGCTAIFIDPITNLSNGIQSGEANTLLQEIAQELAAIAKDMNIVIFIFCHLKAPLFGDSHERGGKVFSSQFAGSRAMMRSCHLMLGIEGDKDPELDEREQSIRKFVVLEDRSFGSSGYVRYYRDPNTGFFNEIREMR